MFERVLGSVSNGIAEDHPQGQARLVTGKALISASQCQAGDLITLGLQGSRTILDTKEHWNLREEIRCWLESSLVHPCWWEVRCLKRLRFLSCGAHST